jgi:hypothetical protein
MLRHCVEVNFVHRCSAVVIACPPLGFLHVDISTQSKRWASCSVFVGQRIAGRKIDVSVNDDLETSKTAPSTFQEVWKYVSSCVSETLLSP